MSTTPHAPLFGQPAVLFDLDDTLYWDDRAIETTFRIVCTEATQRYGVPPHVLEQAVRQQAFQLYATYETYPFVQNIGINPLEALWGAFHEGEHPMFRALERIAPGYRVDAWCEGLRHVGIEDRAFAEQLAHMFYTERRNQHFVYDDTFAVLDRLQGKVQLLLLTNGSPDLQKEKLAGQPRIAAYFTHILISGDFGQGKPAPALFAHALERLEVSPTQAVMIGDKLTTDILGANLSGIESIWINHHHATVTTSRPDHIVHQLRDILPILSAKYGLVL